MGHDNLRKLRAHIIELSHDKEWELAREEWRLSYIYMADEAQTCPCGKYPIKEICVLENADTGRTTEVGNVCVNQFLGMPSESLFASVRRVRSDVWKSFSEEMLDYAHERWLLTDWEYQFYFDIRRKLSLSYKQGVVKKRLNLKILKAVSRRHPDIVKLGEFTLPVFPK